MKMKSDWLPEAMSLLRKSGVDHVAVPHALSGDEMLERMSWIYHDIVSGASKKSAFDTISAVMADDLKVDRKVVYNALARRERLGSTVLPSTEVALPRVALTELNTTGLIRGLVARAETPMPFGHVESVLGSSHDQQTSVRWVVLIAFPSEFCATGQRDNARAMLAKIEQRLQTSDGIKDLEKAFFARSVRSFFAGASVNGAADFTPQSVSQTPHSDYPIIRR